jgi:hypothetical protein
MTNLLGAWFEAANPFGTASIGEKGWSGVAELAAPSVVDPVIQLAANQNAFGRTIAKQNVSELDPLPAPDRAFKGATTPGKIVSKVLDRVSGGDGAEPGAIQLTPDQVDFIGGNITGGVGRESMKVYQTIESLVTGEEIPENRIPILGMFYGKTGSDQSVTRRFYEIERKINIAERGAKSKNTYEARAEYLEEHPEALLSRPMNYVVSMLNKINRARKAADQNGDKEEVKRLDNMASEYRRMLVERYDEIRKRGEK